jgi:hypothetical protein
VGEIHERIRFAGCTVCLKRRELGVLEGINAELRSRQRGAPQ